MQNLPYLLYRVPIFVGSTAHNLFKLSVKIGEVIVATIEGDIRYHFVGIRERFACRIDAKLCQVFDRAYTNRFFKASHEIAFT